MPKYKLDLPNLKIGEIFEEGYNSELDKARQDLEKQLEDKGVQIIKELNESYKAHFKKLDREILNVQHPWFQEWYAAQIKNTIPYFQQLKDASKAVDEGKELLAKMRAKTPAPVLKATLKGIGIPFNARSIPNVSSISSL